MEDGSRAPCRAQVVCLQRRENARAGDRQAELFAVRLAYCQPNVGAFFNFLLVDEPSSAWQSGLFWADGFPKPAYDAFAKEAIADVRAGAVRCA